MEFYLNKLNHSVMQTCLSVRIANAPYTTHMAVLQHSPLFNVPLLFFSPLKFSKPVTLGPGLTRSDSERCCFSPTLLENDPSISQQVDLYLLHGSYCKTARFCENISQGWGDFALRQNPLQGNSEQSTPRIKRNGKELPFQTSTQTFNDPGLLQKLNLSFCSPSFQTFLFQQLANMGGTWKQGWNKG